MTFEEAKSNANKLTSAIENLLEVNPPLNITDVLKAVNKIDDQTGMLPNYNDEGEYIQLILYPSKKWETWSSVSMSISKYNLFK